MKCVEVNSPCTCSLLSAPPGTSWHIYTEPPVWSPEDNKEACQSSAFSTLLLLVVYLCLYICVCVSVFVYLCVCVSMCVYLYLCLCICVCVGVCICFSPHLQSYLRRWWAGRRPYSDAALPQTHSSRCNRLRLCRRCLPLPSSPACWWGTLQSQTSSQDNRYNYG